MLFDFERFTTSAKLAYRRIDNPVYSLDEALSVFRYYFETYELVRGETHPMISLAQIQRIIERMPHADSESMDSGLCDYDPEQYRDMIDQHFITNYQHCDYNINHFFSGRIREMRYFETLY